MTKGRVALVTTRASLLSCKASSSVLGTAAYGSATGLREALVNCCHRPIVSNVNSKRATLSPRTPLGAARNIALAVPLCDRTHLPSAFATRRTQGASSVPSAVQATDARSRTHSARPSCGGISLSSCSGSFERRPPLLVCLPDSPWSDDDRCSSRAALAAAAAARAAAASASEPCDLGNRVRAARQVRSDFTSEMAARTPVTVLPETVCS
mmetsp:Transcript_20014/g.52027  ORF Transcript_20014/g.52027 Transcript_20014/m.52027 type:complete len:210 (-) Transcript_20014:1027-1656(-)